MFDDENYGEKDNAESGCVDEHTHRDIECREGEEEGNPLVSELISKDLREVKEAADGIRLFSSDNKLMQMSCSKNTRKDLQKKKRKRAKRELSTLELKRQEVRTAVSS